MCRDVLGDGQAAYEPDKPPDLQPMTRCSILCRAEILRIAEVVALAAGQPPSADVLAQGAPCQRHLCLIPAGWRRKPCVPRLPLPFAAAALAHMGLALASGILQSSH